MAFLAFFCLFRCLFDFLRYLCSIRSLQIASQWARCPHALCIHMICAANAQTWLNCNHYQHYIAVHSIFQISRRDIFSKDYHCIGILPQNIEKTLLNMRKFTGQFYFTI